MLSQPEGCSDGLTRIIAAAAERGAGSASKYVVAYDGARIVMTVLTWELGSRRARRDGGALRSLPDLLRPVVGRHSDDHHQAADFASRRAGLPADHGPQRSESSVFFSFENVDQMAVFGIAFPHRIRLLPSKPRCIDVSGDQWQQAERLRNG